MATLCTVMHHITTCQSTMDHISTWPWTVTTELKNSYRLLMLQHRERGCSHICGDAGVNKPMALAVIWKYCTCYYGQYILIDSDNNNKWLSYWFLYAQYYTCIVILECTLSTYKKVCCRTVCSVVKAAAFISCFYYVSWSHHFSWLIWSCVVFHNYTLYKLVA